MIMSKAMSYYDWELNFKKITHLDNKPVVKKGKTNSLGIHQDDFKNYLKEWKKKNL